MPEETNGIFCEAASPPSSGVSGPWSRAHVYYSQAVAEELRAYLAENGIHGSEVTAEQAEVFSKRVRRRTTRAS